MKLRELKKEGLHKEMLQWMNALQDFEDKLDSTQISMDECFTELQSRERKLAYVQESATKSNKELGILCRFVEGRLEYVEGEEKEFKLLVESYVSELNVKEKKLGFVWKLVVDSVKEVELREEKLVEQQKLMDGLFKKFKDEQEQVEFIRVRVGERLKKMKLKEICIESRAKEVEDWEKRVDLKEKGVELKEKQIESEVKELDLTKNRMEERATLLENKEKELKERKKRVDLKEKEMALKEKQIENRAKELNLTRNGMEGRATLLESKERELVEWRKRVDLKEKEMELREKQIGDHTTELYSFNLIEREKRIDLQEKEMESIKILSEQRPRELEDKEKLFISVRKLVGEPKEKQLKKGSKQLPEYNEKQLEGKNNKKVSGQKRKMPSGRKIKSPATAKGVGKTLRICEQILAKLMEHKYGWVFNKPVDATALGIPDYHEIIKRPMDLGTVKSRLHKHEYGSPHDFASDVRLTFDNALTYNPKGIDVNEMASVLLKLFEEKFNNAYPKYEAQHQPTLAKSKPENLSRPLAESK